jgi:hypothetical protein
VSVFDEYTSERGTAEEAVQAVRSGDWVEYGFGQGIPDGDSSPLFREDLICEVQRMKILRR